MKRGNLVILLAEDDTNDIFLVQRAVRHANEGHVVHAVRDGREVLDYLQGFGHYSDRAKNPLPNVILTDLKMPRMDGFELLLWLKDHPEFEIIPKIVYSSSRLDEDIRRAYGLGANAYLLKPHSYTDLAEILKLLNRFWSQCECPTPTALAAAR